MAQVSQADPQAVDEAEARERLCKQQGPPERGAAGPRPLGTGFCRPKWSSLAVGAEKQPGQQGRTDAGAQGRCC